MIRCKHLILLCLLLLTACSQKKLPKLKGQNPYAIIFELKDQVPLDFVANVEHTQALNPKADLIIILPKHLRKVFHIHRIHKVKSEHFSAETLVKALKLEHAFYVDNHTYISKSLLPYLKDPSSLDGITHMGVQSPPFTGSFIDGRSPSRLMKDISICFTKRPSTYLTGSGIRSRADHFFDDAKLPFDPARVKYGESVFVKTRFLDTFFETHHPKITHPYFLFTHDDDHAVPGKHTAKLDDPKLLGWFGKNSTDPRIYALPIGIANAHFEHGNEEKIRTISNLEVPKDILLYMNFDPLTNRDKREPAYKAFVNCRYCTYVLRTDNTMNFLNLRRAKFVVSPEGNGLDCHRTWEALIMGTIPIVLTSPLDPLFKDLPVLIVSDWSEVTESLLHETYLKYQHVNFKDLPQLTLNYWLKNIDEKKRRLLTTSAY